MSEARLITIKSSLARQIQEPGGRTVREAERRASQEIEVHRAPAMAAIARALDELDALVAEASPHSGARVYALASQIIDVGGYFDLGPLHEAVYSLCEIADRMMGQETWHWPSVEVHLRAARLILAEDCRSGRASENMLNGLRAVAARITQPAEAATG